MSSNMVSIVCVLWDDAHDAHNAPSNFSSLFLVVGPGESSRLLYLLDLYAEKFSCRTPGSLGLRGGVKSRSL